MKLILDQNLSYRLKLKIGDLFPGSVHVGGVGLDQESDGSIWEYAKANEYAIMTKDDDFRDLAFVKGHPPKVIWLRSGNCRVDDLEQSIRKNRPCP